MNSSNHFTCHEDAIPFPFHLIKASCSSQMGFQFISKAVYPAVLVAAVALFLELLGISTQKLLTAGGLGTVLLTFAGREV